MERYTWPGNIRELENVIERVATLCVDRLVGLADLPEDILIAMRAAAPNEARLAPEAPVSMPTMDVEMRIDPALGNVNGLPNAPAI